MFRVGRLVVDPPVLLAPMAAVTDLPFRTVCEELGVGLTITEFLSAAAIRRGAKKTVDKMQASLGGRHFGVQIFGRLEEEMAIAAQAAVAAGAHVVDINMGCPAKKVVAGECGSALMREPALAARLVGVVRHAVPADIPVTVKHRAGWDEWHLNAPEFACALVEAGAAMITVHGRTRTQGFAGRASLEIIRRVRQAVPKAIPVIGNGDVVSPADYLHMRETTGCDGVMIGRGAMGNPWLFRSIRALAAGRPDPGPPTANERLAMVLRHVELVSTHTPRERQLAELRKVCAWYSRGQRGGAELRAHSFAETDVNRLLMLARNYFGSLRAFDPILTTRAASAQSVRELARVRA
jgi:nifR3 family TIM-barrel protein